MPQSWKTALRATLERWDGDFIVTSPDVDGLLSAALLCEQRGARLIGFYTTKELLLFDGHTAEDARRALWTDHDITHPDILCIGQHLIHHGTTDALPTRRSGGFNPNALQPVAWQNSFCGRYPRTLDKYPFGSIHFLLAGLEQPEPAPGTTAYAAICHADSAWVIPHNYTRNCELWFAEMFPDHHDGLLHRLVQRRYATPDNHAAHANLLGALRRLGVKSSGSGAGRSQRIPFAWRGLDGHQAVDLSDPRHEARRLADVWRYIGAQTGWQTPALDRITDRLQGVVQTIDPHEIPLGTFDAWLRQNDVFSHAFIFKRTLRYTRQMPIGG